MFLQHLMSWGAIFLHGNTQRELRSDYPFYIGHIPLGNPRDPLGPLYLCCLLAPRGIWFVIPLESWGLLTKHDCSSVLGGRRTGWGVIKNAPPFLSFIPPCIHGVFSYILSIIKSLKTCCVEPAEWWDWERRVEERWMCLSSFMHSKATVPFCQALFFQEPGEPLNL